MGWQKAFLIIVLAGQFAWGGAAAADKNSGSEAGSDRAGRSVLPPVLRSAEPADSGFLTLPGAPARSAPAAPARTPLTLVPRKPVSPSGIPRDLSAPPQNTPDRLEPRRKLVPGVLPAEFEREPALYCQKRIGQWTQPDAYNLFGEPLSERPAYSENQVEDGRIYAYSDPTGQYREVELDFAAGTGLLRTVFVYPNDMTWQECRRLWGSNVSSTQANKGRTFYSYSNRRLDVLVERDGRVVSLGLY